MDYINVGGVKMIFKNLCKLCHEKSEFHAMMMVEQNNYQWYYQNQCYPHYAAWIEDHPFVIMSNLDYLEWKCEQQEAV